MESTAGMTCGVPPLAPCGKTRFAVLRAKSPHVLFLLLLFGMLGSRPPARAISSEYTVKAAMLYNLARFVEWPAGKPPEGSAAIVVCVFGSDPFGPILDQAFRDKAVSGRPVLLRRSDSVAGLEDCQILFVGRAEQKRIPLVLHRLRNSSVLTVGETEGFARHGGVVGFTLQNQRLHLEINLEAAHRSGIRISSRLLQLATVVPDGA